MEGGEQRAVYGVVWNVQTELRSFIYRNGCHASSNKCLTGSNKKLLVTSASLLVTSALLVTIIIISHLRICHKNAQKMSQCDLVDPV